MRADSDRTVVCRDLEGREYIVPVSDLNWRPSVYGIVIRDHKILLCRHFRKYNLPGGGLEFGETLEQCLVREVHEETGIEVARPQLVAADSNLFKLPFSERFVQSILLYYACEPVGGELSTSGFDRDEQQYSELAEWVPLSTIDDWQITSSNDWRPFVRTAMKLR